MTARRRDPTADPAASADRPGPYGVPRLLFVEDERSTRAAGAYFQALGYAVDTAARASEALELARARPPDLLIADIRLEGSRTGLDVARTLRETRPSLPVIVLTGISDAELAERKEELDGFTLFRKPLKLLDLTARIQQLIRESRASDPGPARETDGS